MEIWEQSDERRIAAAQARWAAEFVKRRPFECRWCVPGVGGRYVSEAEWKSCDVCEVACRN